MEQVQTAVTDEQQQENNRLKHQLKVRDQLVDQLSAQLFQMVQEHPPALPQARSPLTMGQTTPSHSEVQELEEQISFYQDQIDQRDLQIKQLKTSCQDLRDRNQMLETVIQELPEVYRQQFAERLDQFKEKLQVLKAENQKLQAELRQQNQHSTSSKQKRKLFLPYQK